MIAEMVEIIILRKWGDCGLMRFSKRGNANIKAHPKRWRNMTSRFDEVDDDISFVFAFSYGQYSIQSDRIFVLPDSVYLLIFALRVWRLFLLRQKRKILCRQQLREWFPGG